MASKYFTHSHIAMPRKTSNRTFSFNFEPDAPEGGVEAIRITWNELRSDLASGIFAYNDLESAMSTCFLKVLNRLLSYDHVREEVTVGLNFFAKSKHFVRAARIRADEKVDFDRFLPKAEKMTSANRFSPKGIEWLYLGFDRHIGDAKKCCFAEVRAATESNVKYCEFKYTTQGHKVINLTKADKKSWEEISKPYGNAETASAAFVSDIYFKILSQEIFLPVNSQDKDLEYAPFHCMAAYFKSLGFDGIIYKSTVSDVGKNLVMFDKVSFLPEHIF